MYSLIQAFLDLETLIRMRHAVMNEDIMMTPLLKSFTGICRICELGKLKIMLTTLTFQ